jgi:type IV pilus secretin PilQ/predicted competence protein
MKKIFKSGVFVFIFFLGLTTPKLNADSKLPFFDQEPEISMDFQDANLRDILKLLSIQSGMNFIAAQGVEDRKITLYLDKVPLKEAMDKLFKANNLTYELDRISKIFIVKQVKAKEPEIETETRVFFLKYASVSKSPLMSEAGNGLATGGGGGGGGGSAGSAITDSVIKLLSSQGSIIEDTRTNSLIITDTPTRLAMVAQVIASLDVAVPQIMLEVEMLDVSKNKVDKIGIDWTAASEFGINIASMATRSTWFPLGHFWEDKARAQNTTGTVSFLPTSGLQLAFDFLRSQSDTKFLARPRILTLNNQTAEIQIATDESIGVTSTTSGGASSVSASVERAKTGVILRVTPQINTETGEVTMFVYPKVSEAVTGATLTAQNLSYRFRDPEERSTKSMVRVKDGETIVIGGLIRNDYANNVDKLPILGDLPVIGALFRHTGSNLGPNSSSNRDRERELLVFITPHIIKDKADIKLAQAKKVTLGEREQDAASGVGRGYEISSSLDALEKKRK